MPQYNLAGKVGTRITDSGHNLPASDIQNPFLKKIHYRGLEPIPEAKRPNMGLISNRINEAYQGNIRYSSKYNKYVVTIKERSETKDAYLKLFFSDREILYLPNEAIAFDVFRKSSSPVFRKSRVNLIKDFNETDLYLLFSSLLNDLKDEENVRVVDSAELLYEEAKSRGLTTIQLI